MAASKFSDYVGDLANYKYNPLSMREVMFKALDKANAGEIDIVDPSNPVVFLLEAFTAGTAAVCDELQATLRKTHPRLATTMEELYPHMSTQDQIGLWAKPASTWVYLILRKSDLLANFVDIPNTASRKLVIPRDSCFKVGSTTFSMQYPIVIQETASGAIVVKWDLDVVSPLKSLSTNEIETLAFTATDRQEYFQLKIPTDQFKTTTRLVDLSWTSGLKTDITISDKPYAVRVWQEVSGVWKEIQTTSSTYLYDPLVLTAIVQYSDKKVTVIIPVNYIASGLASGRIRIVVYETLGAVNMALSAYSPSDWQYEWKAIDPSDSTVYTAAFGNIDNAMVYSTDVVTGGSDPDSFETIRQRVIDRSLGVQDIPITDAQLSTALEEQGFTLVKDVDTVTSRVYLATAGLPAPTDNPLLGAASSSLAMCEMTLKQAMLGYGVTDHSDKAVTLSPKTLYRYDNGVYTMLDAQEVNALLALTPAQLAEHFKTNAYAFSPFHYVIDAQTDVLSVRPYYLEAPLAVTKSFVDYQDESILSVATAGNYILKRFQQFYTLDVYTSSNDFFKAEDDANLSVWLSFVSPADGVRYHIEGSLIARISSSDERKYRFILSTDFFIDANDRLFLTDVTQGGSASTAYCDLLQSFDLVYSHKSVDTPLPSSFDALLPDDQLTQGFHGLTHETIQLKFGTALKNLWAQHRSSVSVQNYLRRTADIVLTYEQDVYQLDPTTGLPFTVVDGVLTWNQKLHSAGDAQLDGSGQPIYAYREGDVILDANGVPIPDPNYRAALVRHIGVTLIDGAYYFATDASATNYLKTAISTMVDWITDTLVEMNKRVLDRTAIYFHPKVDQGQVNVLVDGSTQRSVSAAQSFTVKLYVTEKTYNNTVLCSTLREATIKAIKRGLDKSIVSVSAIIADIRDVLGDLLHDVEISKLIDDTYSVVTLVSDSDRLSLKKRLAASTDGRLTVENAIDISFKIVSKK